MKIYNQDKTRELNEKDLDMSLGRLVQEKIVIAHHEATAAIPAKTVAEQVAELTAQGIRVKEIRGKQYRVTATYPNGGEDVEEITEIAEIPAKAAYDDYEDILKNFCQIPSARISPYSLPIYRSIQLSRSALPMPSTKESSSTFGAWRRYQLSALFPASLVQWILDCCPAPIPIACPFLT